MPGDSSAKRNEDASLHGNYPAKVSWCGNEGGPQQRMRWVKSFYPTPAGWGTVAYVSTECTAQGPGHDRHDEVVDVGTVWHRG